MYAIPQCALLLVAVLCLACIISAGLAQEQVFDPYLAEKNLEVGEYYLKKGNYDAAIERFQESIRFKPNYARPHLLLGRAYEKKGEKREAVKYYRKYLEILPAAEDAEKIRKRIAKLTRGLKKEVSRSVPAKPS